MKTTIKLLFVIAGIIYLILAYSCNTTKKNQRRLAKCQSWGVCETVKDSTVIIKKDTMWFEKTPYTIDSDSGYFLAYLECNQENNVILSQYKNLNGKYIRLKHELDQGRLIVTASTPERQDSVDTPVHKSTTEESKTKVEIQWKEYDPDGWAWFQIWSGRILWILLIIYILYRVIKKVFKSTWLGQALGKAGKLLKGGK